MKHMTSAHPTSRPRLAPMARAICIAICMQGTLGAAQAQIAEPEPWTEASVAPPARFNAQQTIPVLVSVNSELRFGVDPQTLQIGEDDVVRYVIIATSASGAQNVLFEGIRCKTTEVKTYARWNPTPPGSWTTSTADWRSMTERAPSRHAWRLAQAGVCDGGTVNRPMDKMLRDLRQNQPVGSR